jgi:small subunit ribosomal protein S17
MSEDEKKDAVEETPQDEGASPAGPVAEDDSSSSRDGAAGEESSSTPPAGEAEKAEEAPAAEESSDAPEAEEAGSAEPAAEQAAEASEEDELPWKEKRRLEKSRRPHEVGPALSPEERAAKRAERRKSKAGMRRKERAAAKAKKTAGTGTPVAERESVAAKVRQGVVVSNKAEKSITVRIDIARRHPTYEKVVRRSRTLHAHDERNEAGEGDIVRVVETRPLSKTKRWRLVEVLERAK